MSDELFQRFYNAGLHKMKPKFAKTSFAKAVKKRDKERWPTAEDFTDYLIFDIHRRIDCKQYGFDGLYPSSYLNGERWEDEIIQAAPQKPPLMERLKDRSWANHMVNPQLEDL